MKLFTAGVLMALAVSVPLFGQIQALPQSVGGAITDQTLAAISSNFTYLSTALGLGGPKISQFNAFDQQTATSNTGQAPQNLLLSLNPPVQWTGFVSMQESNQTGPTFSVGSYFQSTATNSAGTMPNVIGSFGEGDSFSTATVAFLGGLEGLTEAHSGHTTIQAPFNSYARVDAGATTDNLWDFYAQGHVILGSVGVNGGILISDITGGTTNYAIKTGAGWNFHGDVVSIGSTVASKPNNLLYAKGTSTGGVSLGWISDASTFGCLTFQTAQCAIANYFIGSDGTDLRLNSPSATVILAANNAAIATASSTAFNTTKPIGVNGGTNTLFRCSVAGTLRLGQTTTVSADCGTAVDTGLRVN